MGGGEAEGAAEPPAGSGPAEEAATLGEVSPSPPPPTDPAAPRPERRRRRHEARRTFGTRLLTTFAVVLTLVTTLAFGAAGVFMHYTNDAVLERQVNRHLEAVARLVARDLEQRPGLIARARHPNQRVRRRARASLDTLCAEHVEAGGVAEVVVFALPSAAGGAEVDVLGSSGGDRAALLGRLIADRNLAVREALELRRPVSSALWGDQLPGEGGVERWRVFKSAYMPVFEGGDPLAVVGVEIPADFAASVAEVDGTFLFLVAISGLIVLSAAVLLVRQRVHVPVYRLVRAMEREGGPSPARVRRNDEIGVLTEHYNQMVARLAEKDQKLRELYEAERVAAAYLKGYANSLVAGVPEGVVAVDPQGRLTVWNARAQAIFRESHPLGEPLPDPESPLARALDAALRGSATDQALFVIEVPGAAEDEEDRQRLVELTCAPFSAEDGELLGAVAVVSDRTELERFRRAASRNERLGALGSLGGGLAHEIKNPLGAMSGFAELIERKAPPDVARLARRLRDQVTQLNVFLDEFLSFARDERVRREPTDLAELVREAVAQALLEQGAADDEVQRALAGAPLAQGAGELRVLLELDELPRLALDALLLRTVVINLVRNSCQAMPDGGALRVRLHRVGQGVYLRVRDEGPGIPLEERERVFDPLYTTRAEGTGLGLAICHKAVLAHGGKLSVRDAPGGGAELVVRLPMVVSSAPAPGPKAPATAGGS